MERRISDVAAGRTRRSLSVRGLHTGFGGWVVTPPVQGSLPRYRFGRPNSSGVRIHLGHEAVEPFEVVVDRHASTFERPW